MKQTLSLSLSPKIALHLYFLNFLSLAFLYDEKKEYLMKGEFFMVVGYILTYIHSYSGFKSSIKFT